MASEQHLICRNGQVDGFIFLLPFLEFTTFSFRLFLHASLWRNKNKSINTACDSEKSDSFLWFFSPKSIRMILLARETIWVSVFEFIKFTSIDVKIFIQ